MTYNIDDYIPQRYPFKFIDKIISINPGQAAKAYKLVTATEWFFKNSKYNLPNFVLLESMAQTGILAILAGKKDKNVLFGGIKEATFFKHVVPGDKLQLEVKMKKIKGNVGVGQGKVTSGDKIVCQAQLVFVISDK